MSTPWRRCGRTRRATRFESPRPRRCCAPGKRRWAACVAPARPRGIRTASSVWCGGTPAVATVDNAGHIVGVNSGTAVIRAAAANLDKASAAGDDTLRVSAPLEIDSVRPKTVKYGEKLTIYGVGADSIFSASLAGAQLIRVPFSDTAFKSGTARTRFWVPPPPTTDSRFYFGISGGLGEFGFLHGDTRRVLERDIYQPNATFPARPTWRPPHRSQTRTRCP